MTSSTEKDYFSVINDLRYNEHHNIIKKICIHQSYKNMHLRMAANYP